MFLVLFLWILLLSGCFAIFWLVCFALLYCILFHYDSLDVCLLSNERQNSADQERRGGEEELGGEGGGETLIRIYCMKNNLIFNKNIL